MTVVVPTRNRPERLAQCLEALSQLDYPADRLQVVIVDDGSEESPRALVDRFRGRLDLKLLEQGGAGPAA